jgi:protein-disulfide isomerase
MTNPTTKRLSRSICAILSLSALVWAGAECLAGVAKDEIVATLNGNPISLSDVEGAVAFQVYRLRGDIFHLLKGEVEDVVNRQLLVQEAARCGLTVEELLEREVNRKVPAVDEKQIDSYLAEHPADGGTEPGQRDRIRVFLNERARIQGRLDFLAALREKADFQLLLTPPDRPRIRIRTDGEPSRGSPGAPITIVHFSSFTCDTCAQSTEKIRRLLTDFPDKIRWIHRNFFTMYDDRALAAAELAESAHEQGRFWDFHDRIYAQDGDFTMGDLADIAREIGIDRERYEEGRTTGQYLLKVRRDISYGTQVGVTRVPVMFVNGIYVSGTFPYEQLKSLVEHELNQK